MTANAPTARTIAPLLDAQEIARRLNVSLATAYREIRKRMLHVVVGRRALRVTEAAFDAYMRRRSESPSLRQRQGSTRANDGVQVVPGDGPQSRQLVVRPIQPKRGRELDLRRS